MDESYLKEQHADTIYNVQGGLHLHNSPEVIAELNRQKQEQLRQISSVSFLSLLSKEFSDKQLIERSYIHDYIRNALNETGQLLLHGEPGIGKTTTLYQFIASFDNVVYISVKDKSPISVISYLINKIRINNHKDLVEITDVNQGIELLRFELQFTNLILVIDDCEQNPDLINSLISIDKFESKFLFASRVKSFFESNSIRYYPIEQFSENEIVLFLEKNNIEKGTIELNNLAAASKGTPLYLFYFSKHQISPLPQSIADYQTRIWAGLTSEQQDILIFISLPHYPIKIDQLAEILDLSSVIDLSSKIDSLFGLINNKQGDLELFHPTFQEFIVEILISKGVHKHYTERLGDYYLAKNEIIQATFLLLDSHPSKVSEFLLDVFHTLVNWGEYEFAIKVLNSRLPFETTNPGKGYIHYHLCNLYHLLGDQKASTESIDKALGYFKGFEEMEIYPSALMYKAMDLIREGNVTEAVLIADQVLGRLNDNQFKPIILVNLSKLYVDLHEFAKGAEASKEAYELFKQENMLEGMQTSLANLITCLSQLSGRLDEAESYGLHLYRLAQERSEFSLQVVLLNSLTSINRQKKNYTQAREYGSKAIKLCQEYGLKEKVVFNLINYGNVLRDEGDTSQALKIYNEALVYSEQYNLKRDQGRIYWILAGIYQEEGNLDLSIEYAERSIQINTSVNYYYGIANAWHEKADSQLLKPDKINAAFSYEMCADYYRKITLYSSTCQANLNKAIDIYFDLDDEVNAERIIDKWVADKLPNFDYSNIVAQVLKLKNKNSIFSKFNLLFEKYFRESGIHHNLLRQFFQFINLCKGLDSNQGRIEFMKALNLIIENLDRSQFASSILGLGIEQSGELLDKGNLFKLFEKVQKKLPLFSVRHVQEEIIIITSLHNKINLQIHLFDDEPVCWKLALALALIINESKPDIIIRPSVDFLESYCKIWIHQYSEAYQKILKDLIKENYHEFDQDSQSLHLGKNNYSVQEFIIVGNDYEEYCDLNKKPDNKITLYFLHKAIMGIKGHFYHEDVEKDSTQRRFILHSIASLLDYIDPTEKPPEHSPFIDIDLSKLS